MRRYLLVSIKYDRPLLLPGDTFHRVFTTRDNAEEYQYQIHAEHTHRIKRVHIKILKWSETS